MELTWIAAGSVVLVGVGYVVVSNASRFRVVRWVLVVGALVLLSSRDLFRARGRPPAARPEETNVDAEDGSAFVGVEIRELLRRPFERLGGRE